MRVLIVGAGIGGLVTALSLEAAGFRDIRIVERSRSIRGLGVGINLLPHAMRELHELGLGDRIGRVGAPLETVAFHTARGAEIWREPRGTAAGSRWPQVAVHRGALQLELLSAVRERLGDIIEVGHELTDIEEDAGKVTAILTSVGGRSRATGDLLIAADGIHSRLREIRFPNDPGLMWSGATLWRGVAPVNPPFDGSTMVLAGDAVLRFIAYPLGPAAPGGRALLNVIAETRDAPRPTADWNHSVDMAPVVDRFSHWRFPWLDVPATLSAADELLEYPMVDRDPLPRWSFGRTTLLGDAAHAMYPIGSNGASQAILDARTLAMHLAATKDPVEALVGYENERRPATTAVLEANRRGGPEQVMILAAQRSNGDESDLAQKLPRSEVEALMREYRRTAGFDAPSLNERASLNAE